MIVFAIVISYNGIKWIEKCLESLNNSSIKIQTIVVDNNSTDDTVAFIRNNFSGVPVFLNETNLGFGKANNQGIEYALKQKADYIFLLNQDAWVEQNTIEQLINYQKKKKEFGILSPLQLDGGGKQIDTVFQKYLKTNTDREKIASSICDGINIEEVRFVNAASWLISISCLQKVGLFDPLFQHYGEDTDYCNRVKFHGLKVGILLNSIVFHDRVYDAANVHRKLDHRIFSSGLAYLKDINQSLGHNFVKWFLKRVRKIMIYLIRLNFIACKSEISQFLSVTGSIPKINIQRKKHRKEYSFEK